MCFLCLDNSHLYYNCPSVRPQRDCKTHNDWTRAPVPSAWCYSCGATGHRGEDCTSRATDFRRNSFGSTSGDSWRGSGDSRRGSGAKWNGQSWAGTIRQDWKGDHLSAGAAAKTSKAAAKKTKKQPFADTWKAKNRQKKKQKALVKAGQKQKKAAMKAVKKTISKGRR